VLESLILATVIAISDGDTLPYTNINFIDKISKIIFDI